MRDDKTARGWDLPHADNYLEDDVERLRGALTAADEDMTDVSDSISAIQADLAQRPKDVVITSHALTAAEVTAKSFTLPSTPDGAVLVSVLGLVHRPGVDYAVSGNTLSWNGLGLEQNALVEGDVFVLVYKTKGA